MALPALAQHRVLLQLNIVGHHLHKVCTSYNKSLLWLRKTPLVRILVRHAQRHLHPSPAQLPVVEQPLDPAQLPVLVQLLYVGEIRSVCCWCEASGSNMRTIEVNCGAPI